MNQLEITGLKIKTTIGVYAWEQQIKQELVIDLIIPLKNQHFQESLEQTFDYEKICCFITEYVEKNNFLLIETVAERLIQELQTHFMIKKFSIRVSKPHAIHNAKNISILMHTSNDD